jgi:NAD(P)-dependent dehydrogenase (short-subunit alcohol dehydrogenase family)
VISAVVTGVAVGIGYATATRLIDDGVIVVGDDTNAAALEQAPFALGDRFVPFVGDIGRLATHQSVAELAIERGNLRPCPRIPPRRSAWPRARQIGGLVDEVTWKGDWALRLEGDLAPMGRVGSAQELAHVIAFLLSDKAAYIYGTTVPVDGGITARCFAYPESNQTA